MLPVVSLVKRLGHIKINHFRENSKRIYANPLAICGIVKATNKDKQMIRNLCMI